MPKLASWLELKKMNEEQIKEEYMKLSKKINDLSSFVGNIKSEAEYDQFRENFRESLEYLHSLRNLTELFYFNK